MKTEKSLEEAIEDARLQQRGLYAEITVQMGEGHYETVYRDRGRGNRNSDVEIESENVWVVDTLAVIEPDKNARAAARKALMEIYSGSEWYSARYVAGLALYTEMQFRDNIALWLSHIRKNLEATGEHHEVEVGFACGGWPGWMFPITEARCGPDDAKRIAAVRDLAKLCELSRHPEAVEELKNVYSRNDSKSVRMDAGKHLGYSKFRIWLHEKLR